MSKDNLFSAALNGDLDTVKVKINDNNVTNIDKNGNNVLHIAISNDHYDIAEYVLKHFSDAENLSNEPTESGGYTPLHLAKTQRMYDLLISYGATPKENNIGKMPGLYKSHNTDKKDSKDEYKPPDHDSGVLVGSGPYKPTNLTYTNKLQSKGTNRGAGIV